MDQDKILREGNGGNTGKLVYIVATQKQEFFRNSNKIVNIELFPFDR
jgi:hypothetical protein